jgi:hypothetical protein
MTREYNKMPVLLSITAYEKLDQYYREYIQIVDRDDTHILGEIRISDDKPFDASVFLGDRVTSLHNSPNLWIDRAGRAYYVPYWGHHWFAGIIQRQSVDDLERKGWIHLSGDRIANYGEVKVTNEQYDTLALYCEVNDRPMFRNIA